MKRNELKETGQQQEGYQMSRKDFQQQMSAQ